MSNEDSGESTDVRESLLTRREAMGVGSGLLLSAAGLTGTAGAAAAQTSGTEPRIALGDDWEIDDYDDGSGNTNLRLRHIPSGAEFVYDAAAGEWVLGTLNADVVNTEQIGSERHYAGAYDGSGVDARLDNAISAATSGDTIYLEIGSYSTTRTLSKDLTVIGAGSWSSGSVITGSWTLGARVTLRNVLINDGTVTVSENQCMITECMLASDTVDVSGDEFRFIGNRRGTVTFQSETNAGIVDCCVNTSVTDNGTNTVGDIA